ncbi:MAG: hypothetical protein MZW92_03435 [Comamonadaceae bacterium]|nr:hypothetical protein [Comamonadaceae bacterium]
MFASYPTAATVGYGGEGLKAPRTDEMTFAVERELFRDWSVSARYTKKWDRNLVEDVDANQLDIDRLMTDGELVWTNWTQVAFTDPYDGVEKYFWNQDAIVGSDLYLVNAPGAKRDYDGLELSLAKRHTRGWSGMASYVWQNSRGSSGPIGRTALRAPRSTTIRTPTSTPTAGSPWSGATRSRSRAWSTGRGASASPPSSAIIPVSAIRGRWPIPTSRSRSTRGRRSSSPRRRACYGLPAQALLDLEIGEGRRDRRDLVQALCGRLQPVQRQRGDRGPGPQQQPRPGVPADDPDHGSEGRAPRVQVRVLTRRSGLTWQSPRRSPRP